MWPVAASAIDPAQVPPDTLRERIELETFLCPITQVEVRIDDATELVLVDLVSGTTRNFAGSQEVTLLVPPDAILPYI